uniref:Pescadillo homolog n=1 Tax=Albugo laibachii Nc14 TaxID=890382 RepID=F0WEQ7_9STRA|nr:pescadillolike protein putative [Albugo laibachii Nc14]|eukprot:CCA19689.1 pescadillolike protein putative [Albugo laibachii Nc14]
MPTKRVKGKKKLKSIKAKVTGVMGSKRRLSRFGKEQKKGMRGASANYLSRSQTLKKLQISLKDFRRLCILKGIYPREPGKKKKQQQGADKTYYHIKDITYLAHEPLLEHFRSFKTFLKKVISSIGRNNYDDARRRHEHRPTYTLDHLVKERYPRFTDALADLDDALCLIHLFASMPSGKVISSEETEKCVRLVREWQEYNVLTNSLDKVFVSIKGIYYQSTVKGEKITWLIPHAFTPTVSKRVDLHVMVTFLEFYQVLLKFVNYQLYSDLGLQYPPKINSKFDQDGLHLSTLQLENVKDPESNEGGVTDGEETSAESQEVSEDSKVLLQQKESESRVDTLDTTLKNTKADVSIDSDEENDTEILRHKGLTEPLEAAFASNELALQLFEKEKRENSFKNLFENFVFFLSREVPRAVLEFVLCSHGARIGWQGPGSPFAETSEYITHHIVDRPHQGHRYFNREYVQPQWVFDSVNNKTLLPIAPYAPGMELPPHLSPFVDDEKEGYIPDYRKQVQSAAQVLRKEMSRKDENGLEQVDDESEDEEEAYLAGIRAELQESKNEVDDDSQGNVSAEENASDTSNQKHVEEKSGKQGAGSRSQKSKVKKQEKLQQEAKESHDMAKNMMSKKAKRLYDRMQYGLGKKQDKIQQLEAKRARLQQQTDAN